MVGIVSPVTAGLARDRSSCEFVLSRRPPAPGPPGALRVSVAQQMIRSYPAAIGGCGMVATVISAAALAGSFSVSGEMAVAFFLGAFSTALVGGVLLLGSAKMAHDAERRAVERRLEESEARHRALVEHAPFCIVELDRDGRVIASNTACDLLLGPVADLERPPVRFTELFADPDRGEASGMLASAFAGSAASAELRVPGESRDRLLAASFIPLRDGQGPAGHVMGVLQDVTEARDVAARLEHQARIDALTGLVNRREFELRLSRVLASLREPGAEHALCYLDLDEFKIINDTCGHIAGDELLRQAGALLQGCVRRRDTLARLGGDEFGVLMEHCSIEHALRVAEQMRRALDEFRFQWDDKTFTIRASIGLVRIDGALRELEEVLGAADRACYAAKDAGRNRIHLFDAGDRRPDQSGETQWAERLRAALDDGGLSVAVQPIVPSSGVRDEPQMFELLVRMPDPAGGEALPGAFLPAAQRHGLAAQLDAWVVQHGLEWLEASPRRLEAVELMAINVGVRSLADEDFLAFVESRLRGRPALAKRVCFEITETAAIGNLASASRFMHAARALGCRFALDDFGSGLSSFAYLKSLPVDYLKVDGVFVRDMLQNRVDRAVVRAIADIGSVMGKRTIAEFVEDAETAALCRALGIDYVQGNWIDPPRPLASVELG